VQFTKLRAFAYQRVSDRYLSLYPGDETLVRKMRNAIVPEMCCDGFEGRIFCGPEMLDVFGFHLSRVNAFAAIHGLMNSWVNPDGSVDIKKVYAAIASQVKTVSIGSLPYVLSAFAIDFGAR
jgi:hypothetical protein